VTAKQQQRKMSSTAHPTEIATNIVDCFDIVNCFDPLGSAIN